MKIILTLGALLLSASLTFAADGEKPRKPAEGGDKPRGNPEEIFKKLDANSDGSVSKEEYLASPRAKENAERAEKSFTTRDKDKDGKLSKEEFTARPEGGRGGDRPGKKPEGDGAAKKEGAGDKKP
jgi:hypothetical protein